VKSNSSLGILAVLVGLGVGADIVSAGELFRWQKAGGDPAKVLFSGVGKTETEMRAAIAAGIGTFNVESAEELLVLDRIAACSSIDNAPN
jgi:diaminopimelate decarboxylase